MEAVPRLPMLSFELKLSPEHASFGPKLKQHIRDFYHEDPDSYSSEIHSLEGLRATAVCAVKDVTGVAALKRYYCQLHFLHSRFPMTKDGAAAVTFTWRDIYATMVCSSTDIRFEMVCILYNIGALHTVLGTMDSRVTAEGMKMSCTHFQCAAWAFQHIKDSHPQPSGVDLAPDIMQFMYYISLAQAQECILEKSMMDNRKPTIIAKVAVQIVNYYNSALSTLEQGGADDCSIAETVGSKIYKNWKRYVKFKMGYYRCISLLYRGQQAEEQQKMGERVTFYQAAAEKLEEAVKLSKGMDNIEAINDALTFTNDVVEGKKKAAKNENEFIYHEEVPPIDTLPDVKGAILVQGIAFDVNDPEVAGPDIFGRLVPMKAHEASSLYSEEKAKLLRKVGAAVDEKDQELDVYMASLQLEYLKIHAESETLSQELVDRCAAFNAKTNAIQILIDSMNKLADTYQDVESMLQDVKELLQLEEKREKEYQEIMGKRPPSIVATDLTREANKYQEAHAKASESNQTLHKAMTLHISNLRILALPLSELQKQIPSINIVNSPEDQAAIKELQHLIDKVDEMKRQRATLSSQLRESICHDDITRQLVTRTSESKESIFAQEMQKHNKYVNIIDQNLAAQENILKALTEAYAKCAGPRKAVTDLIRKRDATIHALISSYDAYEDLLAKSNKGLEFYKKLETNVSKLLQRVKGTCKVQEEEREQILAKNNKKIQRQDIDKSLTVDSGGPKLKDYLQNIKTTVPSAGYSGTQMSTVSSGGAASANSAMGLAMQPSSYAADTVGSNENLAGPLPWVPPIRPAPVGSEGTAETCGAVAKQDTVYQPPSSGAVKSDQSYQATVTPTFSSSAPQYVYGASSYHHQQQLPYTGDQYSNYIYSQGQQYFQTADPHALPPTNMPKNPSSHSSVSSRDSTVGYSANGTLYQYGSSYQTADNVHSPYSRVQATPVTQTQTTSVLQPQVPSISQVYASVSQHHSVEPQHNYSVAQHSYVPQTAASNVHSSSIPQTPMTVLPTSTASGSTAPVTVASPSPAHSSAIQQRPSYPGQSTSYAAYDYNQSLQYHYGPSYTAQTPAISSSYYPENTQQQVQSTWQEQQQNTVGMFDTEQKAAYQSHSHPVSQNPTEAISQHHQWQQQQSQQDQNVSSFTPSSSNGATGTTTYQYQSGGVTIPASVENHLSSQQQQYYNSMYGTYAAATPYSVQPSVAESVNGAGSTQYQFMSGTGISSYTNAGRYATSQTSSFQTSVDGQTYAAQYNTTYPLTSQSYSHINYYALPYGYQYATEAFPAGTETAVQAQAHQQGTVTTTSTATPTTTQTGVASHMTYMQARTPGDATSTTFSIQGSSSSTSVEQNSNGSSNIDLLAGLDFSLNQKPLIPQQSAVTSTKQEQQSQLNGPSKQQSVTSLQHADSGNMSPKKVILPQKPSMEFQSQNSSTINDVVPEDNQSYILPNIKESEQNTLSEEDRHSQKTSEKDPFADSEVLNQFALEVEKYEKFVEGLTTKTLNGPTPLDMKWKELLELQEKDAHKRSISVARCYPMKNRFPDILPFDHSRVELPSTKDDYINASFIKDLTPNTPSFIATQAPLPSTYADFWVMVWEKQVEVVVCLLNDIELEGQVYWPQEKGSELAMGKMKISLQSCNVRPNWVERIMSICLAETRVTRVIVHLQFTAWPGSSFPASPGPFLGFVSETLNLYKQQRNITHPIVVHCLSGVGRTGLFCLVCAAVCEVRAGHGLLDLVGTTAIMSTNRKGSLRDREHLKFAYQSVLYYAQDLLMKNVGKQHKETEMDEKEIVDERKVPHNSAGSSVTNSCSSSGRTSPMVSLPASSPSLLILDPAQFNLKPDPAATKSRKRYTRDNFTVKAKDASSLEIGKDMSDDPLSKLDPLWPLKRQ